jgi:hypothetical protein
MTEWKNQLKEAIKKDGYIYGEVTKDGKLGSIYTFEDLDESITWLNTEMYNFCERELLTYDEISVRYEDEIDECDGLNDFVDAHTPF